MKGRTCAPAGERLGDRGSGREVWLWAMSLIKSDCEVPAVSARARR